MTTSSSVQLVSCWLCFCPRKCCDRWFFLVRWQASSISKWIRAWTGRVICPTACFNGTRSVWSLVNAELSQECPFLTMHPVDIMYALCSNKFQQTLGAVFWQSDPGPVLCSAHNWECRPWGHHLGILAPRIQYL